MQSPSALVRNHNVAKPQHCARSAFTLVELLIAIVIIAILTVALFTQFSGATERAKFKDHVAEITRIIEKARGYALSNYLVNDTDPAEYYFLNTAEDYIMLRAVAEDGTSETLEYYEFENRYRVVDYFDVYYFPPYGDICFNSDPGDCAPDGTNVKTFMYEDTGGVNQATISIDVYGGFPEVEY